jgi:protein-tyrosine phosphatase
MSRGAVANLRDLGGLDAAGGRRTRHGRVYRSGALDGLGAAAEARLIGLRLRTVFDLRADDERAERPDPVPSRGVRVAGRPPVPGIRPQTALDAETRLGEVYVGLIDAAAGSIGSILRALADDGALPALIHCHAGKDRTGVVAAVLLEILGVERGVVLDDYELSARHALPRDEALHRRLLSQGYGLEAAAAMLSTSRAAMAGALAHLDRTHGGAETYLLGPAGLDAATLTRLRNLLLE